MQTEVQNIIKEIRKRLQLVEAASAIGALTREYEVDINCYVQLVETRGTKMVYYQEKVSTLPVHQRETLLGMYLNEKFGDFKIVGIYKLVEPKNGP